MPAVIIADFAHFTKKYGQQPEAQAFFVRNQTIIAIILAAIYPIGGKSIKRQLE
jgi:chromate transport protein ChrA